MTILPLKDLTFWLSDHPSIARFRWGPTDTWGATWSFLATAIAAHIAAATSLHLLLRLLRRRRPVQVGPIPALHSLSISLVSAATSAGVLLSAAAEIRDTRWLWRRHRTPFQWLLCFPLGTRHSGRIFFWSYIFYLSRFLHAPRTLLVILKNPQKFPGFQVLNHSVLMCTSFVWLEFSQSFQALAVFSTVAVLALVHGYRFGVEAGFWREKAAPFSFVALCRVILVTASMAWHLGVVILHFWKGGCNGMGAWAFNAVLNGFVLFRALGYAMHVKQLHCRKD
ncbi:GNS1/SUR4 membrane protein family [Striga asiatica]|uniref:GNS1/SUR4 membrane protein family n=1 Tax=Striga asiatica TaxID=4170 RepID=A0A5A7PYA9_STRAF|nr:GNS1/SUR4 membrane protein family [Striga asiatica]